MLAVASGTFLAPAPSDGKRDHLVRAQKELRNAENEVHSKELAVDRERNYSAGTNLTLASLESSLNRAKKDRTDAPKRLAEAKKHKKQ